MSKPRIGELLLLEERIDPIALAQTLQQQRTTRQRIVSMLIGRALLDPDDGALALAEQLGYPAALQRHLERRDPALLGLVPPELGARWVVLPIGRTKTGGLVVVARDPTPILEAALAHATRLEIVLSVTPSVQIERLVRAAYGMSEAPPEESLPQNPPSVSDIGNIRLEDETPRPIRRQRTVSDMYRDPELPVRTPGAATPVDKVLEEVDRSITADAAERLIVAYAARRWNAALLLMISGGVAVGLRGEGRYLQTVDRIELPLSAASVLRVAHDSRRASTAAAGSSTQDELCHLLGDARTPAAAPIIVSGHVVAVLVVGDDLLGESRQRVGELEKLVDAIAGAYLRLGRG